MRATILTFALLAATPLGAQTVKTILSNGPVANRYDIVILGDGYQTHEEARFDQDAKSAIAGLQQGIEPRFFSLLIGLGDALGAQRTKINATLIANRKRPARKAIHRRPP